MADQIVSVRMPISLIEELKSLSHENHFLDVSEEVRSLLRAEWLEDRSPGRSKLNAAKESIAKIAIPEKIESLRKAIKLLEGLNEN
jgi:Arc/MetJ-type ribon-helix-helix transcriptional regulator